MKIIQLSLIGLFFQVSLAGANVERSNTSTQGPSDSSWLNQISINADSRLYGPSLTNPSSVYAPNTLTGDPDPKKAVTTENKFNIGYILENGQSVGVGIQGYFMPVMEKAWDWKDPYLFYKLPKVISVGSWRMDLGTKFYAGLSSESKKYEQTAALRVEESLTYSVPETRLSVNLYSYLQKNFVNMDNPKNWDWQYLAIPNAAYRLSSNFGLMMDYKMWAHHLAGAGLFDHENEKTLMGIGMTWTGIRNVLVNPYVDLATGKRIALDTTQLGIYINWKLL